MLLVRWNIVRKERELVVPGSVLARMLHTDKDRTVTIMDDRTGSFGLLRHSEELHQMTALIAFERHAEQPIGLGDGAPSVAIHRLPTESNARLSGHEIGATGPRQPPK